MCNNCDVTANSQFTIKPDLWYKDNNLIFLDWPNFEKMVHGWPCNNTESRNSSNGMHIMVMFK